MDYIAHKTEDDRTQSVLERNNHQYPEVRHEKNPDCGGR